MKTVDGMTLSEAGTFFGAPLSLETMVNQAVQTAIAHVRTRTYSVPFDRAVWASHLGYATGSFEAYLAAVAAEEDRLKNINKEGSDTVSESGLITRSKGGTPGANMMGSFIQAAWAKGVNIFPQSVKAILGAILGPSRISSDAMRCWEAELPRPFDAEENTVISLALGYPREVRTRNTTSDVSWTAVVTAAPEERSALLNGVVAIPTGYGSFMALSPTSGAVQRLALWHVKWALEDGYFADNFAGMFGVNRSVAKPAVEVVGAYDAMKRLYLFLRAALKASVSSYVRMNTRYRRDALERQKYNMYLQPDLSTMLTAMEAAFSEPSILPPLQAVVDVVNNMGADTVIGQHPVYVFSRADLRSLRSLKFPPELASMNVLLDRFTTCGPDDRDTDTERRMVLEFASNILSNSVSTCDPARIDKAEYWPLNEVFSWLRIREPDTSGAKPVQYKTVPSVTPTVLNFRRGVFAMTDGVKVGGHPAPSAFGIVPSLSLGGPTSQPISPYITTDLSMALTQPFWTICIDPVISREATPRVIERTTLPNGMYMGEDQVEQYLYANFSKVNELADPLAIGIARYYQRLATGYPDRGVPWSGDHEPYTPRPQPTFTDYPWDAIGIKLASLDVNLSSEWVDQFQLGAELIRNPDQLFFITRPQGFLLREPAMSAWRDTTRAGLVSFSQTGVEIGVVAPQSRVIIDGEYDLTDSWSWLSVLAPPAGSADRLVARAEDALDNALKEA